MAGTQRLGVLDAHLHEVAVLTGDVMHLEHLGLGRERFTGGDLARETLEVIYAGYLSAATGRRVELAGRRAVP